MSTVILPAHLRRPAPSALLVAFLAIIALLAGGLALHTASGDHRSHAVAMGAPAGAAGVPGTWDRAGPIAGMSGMAGMSGIAAVGAPNPVAVSSAAGSGFGSEFMAACALLLALAGSVLLITLALSRRHRGSFGARGDPHRGSGRRGFRRVSLRVHQPSLTLLSISRR